MTNTVKIGGKIVPAGQVMDSKETYKQEAVCVQEIVDGSVATKSTTMSNTMETACKHTTTGRFK